MRRPDVHRALQAQQPRGLPVEPDDLVLAAQDDHAVRQRRGRAPQFAEQLHQALLVELLAAMQAHHLADDVPPDAAEVGRIDLRAQPQPPVQSIEIEQLPGKIGAGRAENPDPDRPDEQSRDEPRQRIPASRASAKVHIAAMEAGRTVLGFAGRKPIARAAHRLHQALEVVRLERFAQTADVDVDGALLDIGIAAPDPVEQLPAA